MKNKYLPLLLGLLMAVLNVYGSTTTSSHRLPPRIVKGIIVDVGTSVLDKTKPLEIGITVSESSGLNSDDGTICVGAEVVLDAPEIAPNNIPNGFSNSIGCVTQALSYTWSNNKSTDTIHVAPNVTTTYTVTVTDGCSSPEMFSVTITVNSPTKASITISENSGLTADDGIICEGAEVTLAASGGFEDSVPNNFAGSDGPAQSTNLQMVIPYQWSTTENTSDILVTPSITTSYTVTVTDNNFCQSLDTATITVNEVPTPSIDVSETSGTIDNDGTICAGDSLTLTATESTQMIPNNFTGNDAPVQNLLGPSPSLTYAWSNGASTSSIRVAPSITTTYTVTVTSSESCSATAMKTIIVNSLPEASIEVSETSGASNHDGTICEGDQVTLSAGAVDAPNNFAGNDAPASSLTTPALIYEWSNGESTSSITVSPNITTTYTVTVTNSTQCSATATKTIIVNPLPQTPSISVTESSGTTNNDGTICNGDMVTLSAGTPVIPNNFAGNDAPGSSLITPALTYLWSEGSSTSSITVSPNITTTYTVTVTNSNNCSATATKTIIVNPLPQTPSISVTESSGTTNNDGTICNGDMVTLSAGTVAVPNSFVGSDAPSSSLVTPALTYLWSEGSSTSSITVSPNITTTYTVTVTNSNKCSATATKTIIVNPLPQTPSISVTESSGTTNNDGTICNGDMVTLSAGTPVIPNNFAGNDAPESSLVTPALTYLWSEGSSTSSITVSPNITTTYTVTVTNSNKCSATATKTIVVNPLPETSINISETSGIGNNDGTICNGDSVTLSAATPSISNNIVGNDAPSQSLGTVGLTYAWSTGATTSSIRVAPSITTTYTLTVTNSFDCSETASEIIIVDELPNPSISVSETSGSSNDDGTICKGDEVTLSVTEGSAGLPNGLTASNDLVKPTFGPVALTYLWSNGSSSSSITVSPDITTTYTVTVTNAGKCSATASSVVVVNGLPSLSIDFLDYVCKDSTITLTSTIDGDSGPYSNYQWTQSGDGSVEITNNEDGTATAKALTEGKVYIEFSVTDANGCSAEGNVRDSLVVFNCAVAFTNDSQTENTSREDYMINDPCTCKGNGLFDETVWIEPGLPGQIWTVKSISPLRVDGSVPQEIAVGDTLDFRQVNDTIAIYEISFVHVDSSGFEIIVEGPNGPGSQGNVFLTTNNVCYYPDVALSGLPALISPTAVPFVVSGNAANDANGLGTFILNGNTQPGASPSPSKLKINPASLLLGINTLDYGFDADTAGAKNLSDPGCVTTLSKTFQVANCSCQDVAVQLDSTCKFRLLPNLLSDGNCAGATVRVMDSNPGNGDIIDCAGVWTYGLFDSFGNILCWGKVTAEDKTPPVIVCQDWYTDTLDCFDVSYVLNNPKTIGSVLDENGGGQTISPRSAGTGAQTLLNAEGVPGNDFGHCDLWPSNLYDDHINNLGYTYFRDNCRDCGCRVTLKWSDKVVFYSCDSISATGIYARIFREWVATDCNGMSSSVTQVIPFARPDVLLDNNCGIESPFSNNDFKFRGAGSCGEDAIAPAPGYDWVVQYNSCTPDKSLIKKEDVTPSFRSYLDRINPKFNRLIYIDEVECNYSVQIKDTEFPICGGKGVKIDREMYIFDWCKGSIIDTIHILIKIGDFTPPKLEYAHHAPFEISTGPMDCTAAFPVTVAGIKTAFGVSITDNCLVANATVSVKTKDRYVKGILVAENTWDKVDYAIMNGMMIGVPVGQHRLIIDAFDGCYNAKRDSFTFVVKDKIAPVMKCDDQLNISLSNGNGYTTGYAQATAEEINEGSWDNCKLAWIAVRRNVPTGCEASFIGKGYDTNGNGKLDAATASGDVSKADGFDRNDDGDLDDLGETFILKGGKLMTPLQDKVEFFCCDLTERVSIELWGGDVYGNTNFCWDDVLIEDKVAPTCLAPWALTVDCDEKCLEKIDDRKASALCFGDITITSGNDCGALDTVYKTDKKLKCGYGYIDRIWTLTKQTVKGPISITCTQRITIRPIHEYNICFPKDVASDCKTPIIDTIITDELACDILSVNITDKRYDASDDECYKIFRTYSVINWCTYDDRCGDPLLQNNISIIDRGYFDNYGKAPLYVLVRDANRNLDEEFYISKDLIPNNADDIRFTPPYCTVAGEYYHSFIYTQIIKVYDDVRPVVTGTPGKFCIREGGDCLANLKMVITGKDNCSNEVTLETQYLMIAPGQTLDASKMIMYATPRWSTKDLGKGDFEINVANLPQGKHDLIVVVRDECGNLSVPTRIPFTIEDCKGPAPICINGLSTELMPDGNGAGMMAVWASDFVASKIYDCNGQGPEVKDGLKLVTKYSLNRVGEAKDKNKTSLNLTCADKGKVVLVELHAWDEAGNDDFCVTYVEVQDNRKVCPGSGSLDVGSIAGTIATEGAAKIEGVSVNLSGHTSMTTITPSTGTFAFANLSKGSDFTVTPLLDKNHLNGVSTFDLILIQKHILGVQLLQTPYKLIAADVNNSKSITTLDMIQLRKLILSIDQNFANNTSWRFVDATYRFPDPSNPWATNFPEVVSVNNLESNITANFIAIKVGDVNASAIVNTAITPELRTEKTLNINTEERQLKAGQEYKIDFTAEDLNRVQGYQFALNLDQSKVEFADLIYGIAKAENFGVFTKEGLITTSWNGEYQPGVLFTLVLRAKADGLLSNAIGLNRLLRPEAYNLSDEQLNVSLDFNAANLASEGFELLQNTPNPFIGETLIGFNLPKAASVTLIVRDVKGALLYQVKGNYPKGNSQLILKKEQVNANGVLYYTLETNEFTATKKMIVFE